MHTINGCTKMEQVTNAVSSAYASVSRWIGTSSGSSGGGRGQQARLNGYRYEPDSEIHGYKLDSVMKRTVLSGELRIEESVDEFSSDWDLVDTELSVVTEYLADLNDMRVANDMKCEEKLQEVSPSTSPQ